MPFVLNDGTKPPNFTKPLAPAPHKLYDHAREKGEFISQTVRESSLPDYAVNLDNPVDAAPIATANAKADRPLLPVFKHAIPLNDPIAPVRLPMRVKLSPQEEKESKQWRKVILRAMASLPPSVMVTVTLPRAVFRAVMTLGATLPAMATRVQLGTSLTSLPASSLWGLLLIGWALVRFRKGAPCPCKLCPPLLRGLWLRPFRGMLNTSLSAFKARLLLSMTGPARGKGVPPKSCRLLLRFRYAT